METPLCVGEPVERRLELIEPARLRLERGKEGMEVRGRLAQAQLHVPELVAGALELGRETLERRHGPLGDRGEPCGSRSVVRSQCGRGGGRRLGELGNVPEPLALGAQPHLVVRLHSLGVLGEGAQLHEARPCTVGVDRELLVPSASR